MVLHTSPAQPLDKTWEFPVDNKFAAAFIQRNGLSEASFNPRRRHHKPLCSRCAQLNLSISTSILRFKGGLAGLRTDAHACRLHRLLLQACGSAPLDKNADLEIRRSGSNLYCRGHSSPILSLCRPPCTFFPLLKPVSHWSLLVSLLCFFVALLLAHFQAPPISSVPHVEITDAPG